MKKIVVFIMFLSSYISYAKNIELQAKVLFQEARVYLRTDQFRKAIAKYTEAIEKKPNFAKAYHQRGTAFYYLKDSLNACKDWNIACEKWGSCTGILFAMQWKICTEDGEPQNQLPIRVPPDTFNK